MSTESYTTPRHDWQLKEIESLYALPFNDLLFLAQSVHRAYFDPNEIQISTLLSIKTGGCPEDCKYCPQSAHYQTEVDADKLMDVDDVLSQARLAKEAGATRFCMGAAWRSPKERDMQKLENMIEGVKAEGLETCMTLGMLEEKQADRLATAGLDYYNHNIDTSEEFYKEIISTRTFDDRLQTLQNVQKSGMNVCSGGIIGMGESLKDRASMLQTLSTLPTHPKSVPINHLVKVEGTPFDSKQDVEPLDFVRTIAVARIVLPQSYVRLSAGRETMSEETQALCFAAGANSIFYGEKLLTTANPEQDQDMKLLAKLGISVEGKACAEQAKAA